LAQECKLCDTDSKRFPILGAIFEFIDFVYHIFTNLRQIVGALTHFLIALLMGELHFEYENRDFNFMLCKLD
jgi:hypothetical protein